VVVEDVDRAAPVGVVTGVPELVAGVRPVVVEDVDRAASVGVLTEVPELVAGVRPVLEVLDVAVEVRLSGGGVDTAPLSVVVVRDETDNVDRLLAGVGVTVEDVDAVCSEGTASVDGSVLVDVFFLLAFAVAGVSTDGGSAIRALAPMVAVVVLVVAAVLAVEFSLIVA
jgi:hypothetical protein